MPPRLRLALTALILVAGAVALGWTGQQPPAPAPARAEAPARSPSSGDYVLALSWHPAFCERQSRLPECRNERSSDYTADHFALHGLWPQDLEYCGVSNREIGLSSDGRWDELPAIDVGTETWAALARVMPGVEDGLERHQWTKHGTCSGADAETFFARSVDLLDEINASGVRDLFARNIGRHVSRDQTRAALDAAFGDGAGARARLNCTEDGPRTLIGELRLNLSGDVLGTGGLAALLRAADRAGAGCTGGEVDPVGRQ